MAPEAGDMLMGALRDEESLVSLTLKGKLGPSQPWKSVTIRPVLLKTKRKLQFSFFGERQNIVKNHEDDGAQEQLAQLLDLPWSSAQLQGLHEELSIQFTRSGKPIIHRTARPPAAAGSQQRPASAGRVPSDLHPGTAGSGPVRQVVTMQHDRKKELPISPTEPHAFLQKLGMQTADGRIKADMQDKFTQVNEFLKLLGHTGALEQLGQGGPAERPAGSDAQPVCILDCGCGSSHLTFGTYHYLTHVLGMPARIMGVDTNAALMQRSNEYCRQLGMDEAQAQFFASPILKFRAPAPPDVVLALHACDTATDEALALGIKQGAPVIMAVPCCHKNLHRQMSGATPPVPFGPLMRHGIMKQRQIDMLTDTFRAQLLRIMGYKTDAVEFISAEHTPRNLLLRAVRPRSGRSSAAGSGTATQSTAAARQALEEYDELKEFWGGVTPYLETLLDTELQELRGRLQE